MFTLTLQALRSSDRVKNLNRSRAAQQAHGESEDCRQESKYTFERNADEAQGETDQPDKRISDQGEHSQRPAQNEQDAPQQKFNHESSLSMDETNSSAKKFR